MLDIRTISSASRNLCTDEITQALTDLEENTQFLNRLNDGSGSVPVDITITEGISTITTSDSDTLTLTDSGDWVARTHLYPDGHIGIYIPAELLEYGEYVDSSGGKHPITLERVLGHEMTHAWQFANGTNIPGYDPSNPNDVEGTGTDTSGHSYADPAYHPESADASENYYMGSSPFDEPTPVSTDDNRTSSSTDPAGNIYTYNTGSLTPTFCIHEPPPGWVPTTQGLIQSGEATGSPLVMDLSSGGTGITLSSADTDPVYWDIASEGMRHASGWVSGDTGLLCIDLNSNGIIDDNSELFGNSPAPGTSGATANGFQSLAAYDSNSDGVIDSSDTQFGDLRVWVDANHDGISQSDELYTLSDLGITSINLSYSDVDYTISGNTIKQESTFTMGGETRTIADAWFTYDPANTIDDSEYTGGYTLDDAVALLPNQRGYGLLPDLHVAMSGDSTLLSEVQDVASQSLSDLLDPSYHIGSKMLAIAYEWAGVEGVSPTSRGSYFDGQKLGFLEKLFDFSYWGAEDSSPGPNSQTYLDEAWPLAFGAISANILGQTALGDLFGNPGYSVADDTLSGGTWNSDTAIQFASLGVGVGGANILYDTGMNDIYLFQPGDSPISGSYFRIVEPENTGTNILLLGGVDPSDVTMWDDTAGNLIVKYSSTDQVQIDGSVGSSGETLAYEHVQEIAFSNGTIWDLTNGLTLTAVSNSQILYGTSHGDTLVAEGTYNQLFGYAGNDTLVASAGAIMHGGTGDDTYVFSAGSAPIAYGGASIYEYSGEGTDTIAFHGIDPANVTMWDDTYGNLIIQYSSGDQAIVENGSYNATTGFTVGNVEQITFDDTGHTTWDLTGGLNLTAASNSQELDGTSNADTLTAEGTYNQLYGYAGNDTLVASAGAAMHGGTGDDTYVFSAGSAPTSYDGADIYENSGEGTDTIAFHGIDPANVTLSNNTYGELVIHYSSTDEAVIENGSYNATTGFTVGNVEQITFDDTGHTTWDLTGGLTLSTVVGSDELLGTSSGDTITAGGSTDFIYGFGGNDTLVAAGSNDYLYGGAGADTFKVTNATTENNIMDFSTAQGDKIDLSSILTGYDPLTDSLSDFVQKTESSGNTIFSVDTDGPGGAHSMTDVAFVSGVTGLGDLATLVANGTVVV